MIDRYKIYNILNRECTLHRKYPGQRWVRKNFKYLCKFVKRRSCDWMMNSYAKYLNKFYLECKFEPFRLILNSAKYFPTLLLKIYTFLEIHAHAYPCFTLFYSSFYFWLINTVWDWLNCNGNVSKKRNPDQICIIQSL